MSAELPIDKASAKPVDKIGAFPAEFDTDALPERRSAALARMMSIVAVVEGFAIVGLSFALAALVPLQKVIPMVVTSNSKGDEIIRVNPVTLESPTADYVSEIALRDYVTKRYSIVGNSAEQAANVQIVGQMSTPEAFQAYGTRAKSEWERLRAARMTRSVRIDSVRKLGEMTWQVEYSTTDKQDESPLEPSAPGTAQSWITTFVIAFEAKNVKYADRLNNPFGLTIVSANDARRD